MTDQRIDQCPARLACTRMHHEAGRLVDDDNIVILIKNCQRNILGLRERGRRRRHDEGDFLSGFQLAPRLIHDDCIEPYLAIADESLNPASRQIGAQLCCKPLVDPHAGIGRIHAQLFQYAATLAIRNAHRPTGTRFNMAETAGDNAEEDKPLDPAVERVRSKLIRFMIINLGILFIALMAVVVAIVYRMDRGPKSPSVAVSELPVPSQPFVTDQVVQGRIEIPPDARITSHSVSGNLLSIDLAHADGSREILVYDLATGRLASRVEIITTQ